VGPGNVTVSPRQHGANDDQENQARTRPPVVVTVQPVTRCADCQAPVTYPRQAGAASAALTAHYNREHS